MNSIAQALDLFLQNCTASLLSNSLNDFGDRMSQILSACNDMLGTVIPNLLQEMDETIFLDAGRKAEWQVVRIDERTLTCVFGELRFQRRYYRHKSTGEVAYLLDKHLGIEAFAKVNGDVRQRAVAQAEQGSYAKSAAVCAAAGISRMSVHNYVGDLKQFPELKAEGDKRSVPLIFIEADEDHASLQDGRTAQVKLVYVHEGVATNGQRRSLLRARFFTWPSGASTDALWQTVSNYIDAQYVTEDIEHIFLSGDGGSWIRKGEDWLYPCVPVLDGFHTRKALKTLFGGSSEQATVFMRHLRMDERTQAWELCKRVLAELPKAQRKKKAKLVNYLKNNWQRIRNQRHPGVEGCSAEGHVSHILSERLSSRPRGWCTRNLENVAQLRVMKANGQVIRYAELRRKPLQKGDAMTDQAALLVDTPRIRKALTKTSHNTLNTVRGSLPILAQGVTTQLYQALHSLSFGSVAS